MAEMKFKAIGNNNFYYDDEFLTGINGAIPSYGQKNKRGVLAFCQRWIRHPNDHEAGERALIKRNIKSTDTVLELGGFIGVTACLTNDIIDQKEGHVVVERDSALIKYLQINRDRNGKKFIVHPRKIEKIEELDCYGGEFNSLIMDIEGDEYCFLPDNAEYISRYIEKIIIEFHPKKVGKAKRDRVNKLLKRLGFTKKDKVGKCRVFLHRKL